MFFNIRDIFKIYFPTLKLSPERQTNVKTIQINILKIQASICSKFERPVICVD